MAKSKTSNKNVTLPPQFQSPAPGKSDQPEPPKGHSLHAYLHDVFRAWDDVRRREIVPIWRRAWNNFNSTNSEEGVTTAGDSTTTRPNRGSQVWRSKSFHPLTEQKVMAGTSQIDDVLFRSDKFPYEFSVSPISDAGLAALTFEEGEAGMTEKDKEALQAQKDAAKKMRLMKLKVDDQLAECKAIDEGRRATYYASLYGTAVIETPIIERRVRNRWKDGKLKQIEEDVPTFKTRDIWDTWPDPDCEGDVQKGRGFFIR